MDMRMADGDDWITSLFKLSGQEDLLDTSGVAGSSFLVSEAQPEVPQPQTPDIMRPPRADQPQGWKDELFRPRPQHEVQDDRDRDERKSPNDCGIDERHCRSVRPVRVPRAASSRPGSTRVPGGLSLSGSGVSARAARSRKCTSRGGGRQNGRQSRRNGQWPDWRRQIARQ